MAFDNVRARIARMLTPRGHRLVERKALVREFNAVAIRSYQAAKHSRLTAGWSSMATSSDSELTLDLSVLRARSRDLIRNASYAKRARTVVQNNIIGSGIGMQAHVMSSRDTLRQEVNDAIELAWEDWCAAQYCHTGGAMHFHDLERALMGQVFDAGEVFIRMHYRGFGESPVPFALEMIEAERIVDESQMPVPLAPMTAGAMVRMGIEMDSYGRALGYFVRSRHPGELRFNYGEVDMISRYPADQIIHLRLVDRWPQTRAEPWLHTAARKLNDMDAYSESEVVAARAAASYIGTIESPEATTSLGDEQPDGSEMITMEPGIVEKLAAGEKFELHSPNRPNTALDPFMRYMLREIAAGVGVSYEALSRDYSQSNYSSSRLALIDDRDLWRFFQQWFIRSFRKRVHAQWMQQAVLAGAIPQVPVAEYVGNRAKFEKAMFKPRGWGFVDPDKEIKSYKEAITGGMTTLTDVIAATGDGDDLEDKLRKRQRELQMMEELGLQFDTNPEAYIKPEPEPEPPPAAETESTEESGSAQRVITLKEVKRG
jgi:lambda family phage portal protein